MVLENFQLRNNSGGILLHESDLNNPLKHIWTETC